MRWGKQYEEDKIISKDILIYICNDAFNFLYSALVDFPNCACPKCSCHEYISDKCRGEHFVRSRYAPAHYSNHVENISDFYTLLRHYIGIVFILFFKRHNHSDIIALKIRKSNVEIGARQAKAAVLSTDEIGALATDINNLYQSLLLTIRKSGVGKGKS